jgi:hypothetical protein
MITQVKSYKEYLENYLKPLLNSSDYTTLQSLYEKNQDWFHNTLPDLRKKDPISFVDILTEQELIDLIHYDQSNNSLQELIDLIHYDQSNNSFLTFWILGGFYTRDVSTLIFQNKMETIKKLLNYSGFVYNFREENDNHFHKIKDLDTATKLIEMLFKRHFNTTLNQIQAYILEFISPDIIDKINTANIKGFLDNIAICLYEQSSRLLDEGYQTIKALALHPAVKQYILFETNTNNIYDISNYISVTYFIFHHITEEEFIKIAKVYLKSSSKFKKASLICYPKIQNYPDIYVKALTALFKLNSLQIDFFNTVAKYGFKLHIPNDVIEKLSPEICFTILDKVFQNNKINPNIIVTNYQKILDKAFVFAFTSPYNKDSLSKIQLAISSYQNGFTTIDIVQRFTYLIRKQNSTIKLKVIQKILDSSIPDDTKNELIQLTFLCYVYNWTYSQAEGQFGCAKELLIELNNYIQQVIDNNNYYKEDINVSEVCSQN